MWKLGGARVLRGCLLSAGLVSIAYSPAAADWAQTLGIGQKSTNLGSAVTATSDDYDAFYTNPAGAANFDGPFVGFGIKTLDTRTLSAIQTDANQWPHQTEIYEGINSIPILGEALASVTQLITPPQNGVDLSPERTLPGADIAIVPSGAGYMPVPGMRNIVVGVGTGTPFLLSADFGNDGAQGNYGKFDTTSAGLVVVETSPSVAVKVNDKLNVGASLGITTFKYFQISNELGAPNVNVPLLNQTLPLGAGTLGRVSLQTDSDVKLPGIEPEFATGLDDFSYTLGVQYKFTPKLTGGVTYRSKTPETFTGTAKVDIDQIGIGSIPLLSVGPYKFTDKFKYEVELPAHIQAGLAYAVTPKWKVMADVRWTNWSDAKGFGTPTVIHLMNGTIDPGGAIEQQACLLGKKCSAVASLFKLAGVKSAPLKSITVNYGAEDTISLHFGTAYKLTNSLELQAGYIYDPSFMPDEAVDLITFSSNRHIFSLGGAYTQPVEHGEWAFTLGGQVVYYEDRHIDVGSSQTAGGINGLDVILTNSTDVEYGSNTLGGFDIGGYVWSVGGSVSYKFGSSAKTLETGYDLPK